VSYESKVKGLITQKELKELLKYNSNTGVFAWIGYRRGINVGSAAGNKCRGYINIYVKGRKYPSHRLAWLYMKGVWPKHQIDHINHIRDDNRWINLREATNQENGKNKSLQKNNTSGVIGVRWHKQASKWHSQICVKGKSIHLGFFDSKEKAIAKRETANILYGFHENHGSEADAL